MIVSRELEIDVDGGKMSAYLAQPGGDGSFPAVIVLEGVYGFDEELRRITDLVAAFGYVGLAINYFHRSHPQLAEPFTPEGRARGEDAAKAVTREGVLADVGTARDWLHEQPFVDTNNVGTWGFGFGGTVAFVTATLPGINAAVVFYGQSITSLMPSGDAAPLEDVKEIRSPLLLVFGGRDQLISEADIKLIETTLTANNKKFEVQMYPNVGHSFFRATSGTQSAREAADAWDRVQAYFKKYLR
jgi:carboxymethylenebutenolidase